MPMRNPPHPGLSVRHDCLEPLGLSVNEAARKLGVSSKQLSDVVNCRSGISPEMAIRLGKAFGGGAATWVRVQATHDLAQAMRHADRIKVERLTISKNRDARTPLLSYFCCFGLDRHLHGFRW
jgi:addiction module HigA family antidote